MLDGFDVALFAIVVGLLFGLVKLAYDEGVEAGWKQAGRWADDYVPDLPLPATRHDRESLTERTFPYRGEVD